MAEVLLGAVGAGIGGALGGLQGAQIGLSAGVVLGNLLFPQKRGGPAQGRLSDLKVQGASQGTSIPIVYGRARVAGNIVWATEKKQHKRSESVGGKGGGQEQDVYSYTCSFLVILCDNPIQSVRRVFSPEKVAYDNRAGQDKWAKGIDPDNVETLYGSALQMPSWIVEEVEGVGNVPGYRGFSGQAYKSLNLDPWSGNLPNWNYEVDTGAWSVGDVLRDLSKRAGLPLTKCDFSAMDATPCRGFVIPSQLQVTAAWDALGKVYGFDVVELDGKIKAVKRGGAPSFVLTWDELGYGSSGGERIYFARAQEVELPKEVVVTYPSEALDFQEWSQSAQRSTRLSQSKTTIGSPVLLSDDEGRRLALRTLFEAWEARIKGETSVAWERLLVAPTDVGTIQTPDGDFTVRVKAASVGMVGAVALSFVGEEPSVYTQTLTGVAPGDGGAGVASDGNADFAVIDTNAVRDDDADDLYLYGAIASDLSGWDGGDVRFDPKLKRRGGDTNLTPFARFKQSSTFGRTTTTLGAAEPYLVDTVNTVTVQMVDGALESVTLDELYGGANLCVLGTEIMQFQTATLTAPGEYVLSSLVRGRRGTEEVARAGHGAGEPFSMVDEFAKRVDFHYSQVGRTFDTRLYEVGVKYDTTPDAVPITVIGNSRRPYAPAHLRAERVGDDAHLTWLRRVRKGEDLVGADAPLDEPAEEYELEIYDATTHGLLREVHISGGPAFVYTSAMQTTDMGAPGPFSWRVWQYTTARALGRGRGSVTMDVE